MVVLLNLKKHGIILLLLIILTSVSSAELQNNSNITNTESNIVIVIDASASTGQGSPSSFSLISANALYILKNAGCNRVGIVAYGVEIKKTNLLSLCDDANKIVLENFLKTIVLQRNTPVIDDLDKGLHAADELLNSVTGTKEIIIISDGLIDPKGLTQTKNTVLDLTAKETKIQFIQVLLSTNAKIPNDNYDILAKAAGTNVRLLYPNERVSLPIITPSPTSTNTPTVTITSISKITSSILKNESNLEQEIKELKERLNKVEENQQESRKSWFESIIDWIKSIF